VQQHRQCQYKLMVFNSDQLPIRLPLDPTVRIQPHEEHSSLHFAGCTPPKPLIYNLMSDGLFVPLSMSRLLFLDLTLAPFYPTFIFSYFVDSTFHAFTLCVSFQDTFASVLPITASFYQLCFPYMCFRKPTPQPVTNNHLQDYVRFML